MYKRQRLVRWLCQKYQIAKAVLPPDLRFETTKAARDFAGIVSHVNYRTSGKWDIGPTFDWDGFVAGINAPVPSATRGGTMKSKPGVTEDLSLIHIYLYLMINSFLRKGH